MTVPIPEQPPGIEVTHDPEIPVRFVQLWLCDLCLDGAGGECHVPGCSLWINRAADLSLRGNPMVTILAPQQELQADGRAAYETWRAAVPDFVCNVPGGPWEDLSPAVQAGFAAIAAQQPQPGPELPFPGDREPVMTPAVTRPYLGSMLVLAVGEAPDESVGRLQDALTAASDGVTVVTVRGVEALRTWEPQPAPGDPDGCECGHARTGHAFSDAVCAVPECPCDGYRRTQPQPAPELGAAMAGIDPVKLDLLADWFDQDDATRGRLGNPEVQADLRRWAQLVRDARQREGLPSLRRNGPPARQAIRWQRPWPAAGLPGRFSRALTSSSGPSTTRAPHRCREPSRFSAPGTRSPRARGGPAPAPGRPQDLSSTSSRSPRKQRANARR